MCVCMSSHVGDTMPEVGGGVKPCMSSEIVGNNFPDHCLTSV